LTELSRIEATLVLFESGNRVQDSLADLADIMGAREAAICRELTKLHEDTIRAPLSELARTAGALETRGEFVLVVGPPASDAQTMAANELDDLLRERLRRDSVRDAVAHAVALSGRPRREVYARALELAKDVEKPSEAGGDGQN
jgi:16S rRNA (cytidine1402-2'-O)-methyltransferase